MPEWPGLFSGRSHVALVISATGDAALCLSVDEVDPMPLRSATSGMARTFAACGATVGIADINTDPLPEAIASLQPATAPHWSGVIDVADENAVDLGVSQCWSALGGIDLLVNNAGLLSVASVVDLELADWRRIMDVNATGVFLMSRTVVRKMLAEKRAGSLSCGE